MATPVSWRYGPWRSQDTQTSASSATGTTSAQPIASPYVAPDQLETSPFDSVSALSEYGPMTADERSTLGKVTGGPLGWGSLALGYDMPSGVLGSLGSKVGTSLADMGVKAATQSAAAPLGALGLFGGLISLAEQAMNKLGVNRDRGTLGMTPAEMQGLADKLGYGMPTGIFGTTTVGSPVGGVSVGPSGYGTTGPSTVDAPSVSNPDSAFGPSGEPGGGGGESNADSSGTAGGGGGAGAGGGEERGGVHKTKPGKPRWAVYGEGRASREGETGIFVPEYMKRPGQQGRESQVEAAMKTLLQALRG